MKTTIFLTLAVLFLPSCGFLEPQRVWSPYRTTPGYWSRPVTAVAPGPTYSRRRLCNDKDTLDARIDELESQVRDLEGW